MHRFTSQIRRPVKRQGAEQYLLITLLSFAASVVLTRLFLELTGYPKIGSGQVHIAHVLWGGLLLFIAALLPLTMANRWIYTLGAVLAGAGVGLFIDEVGKFITQNNDYFTPWAAPIIYAFFLLTVILYLQVSRPPLRGPRSELYRAFDSLEEVLEHDLDPQELTDLENRLTAIAGQDAHPDLARLARDLLDFLHCEELTLANRRPGILERVLIWWRPIETRWVIQPRFKAALSGGLLALGLISLSNMILALPLGPLQPSLVRTLTALILSGQVSTLGGLYWFAARLALESSVGLILLVAAALIIMGRDRLGAAMGSLGLLLSLTVVDLLTFYFDQFSAIFTATVQFVVFLSLAYYRNRFLQPAPLPSRTETAQVEPKAPA